MNSDSPAADALAQSCVLASRYLRGLSTASTSPTAPDLAAELPEEPGDVADVIAELFASLIPGVMPSAGPRYFGFVTGGTLPAALGADVLASAWNQNGAFATMSPAVAAVEEACARWVVDLLGLPGQASVGFVTGATMANWTALAAARAHLMSRAGWDVTQEGMTGAPPMRVVVGAQRHSSIDVALRYLGVGVRQISVVPCDDQGRMRADRLAAVLQDLERPVVVCAQVGNVNSGAVDPMNEVVDAAGAAGAWVHVDAAVGAWWAASADLRQQLRGWERADSWALDAHKGLNVGYDSGIVLTRHSAAHRAATAITATYLPETPGARDGSLWVPESSRRARALPLYAALRSLGRSGVAALVERQCSLARLFADGLDGMPSATVRNEVTGNQVLVSFGSDHRTDRVIEAVQHGGVCWMGGTTWRGERAMRISVSNWMTSADDVHASLAEIERCLVATAD